MALICLSFLLFLVFAVNGHQNFTDDNILTNGEQIPNDAELQVGLMPQELNTAFIPNKKIGQLVPKELQALMPQELDPLFNPPDTKDQNAIVVGWAPIYYYPRSTTTSPSPMPATSRPDDTKDIPWKVVLPVPQRTRRGLDLPEISPSTSNMLKKYTRIGALFALILSAIVEVSLYVIEWYHGHGVG